MFGGHDLGSLLCRNQLNQRATTCLKRKPVSARSTSFSRCVPRSGLLSGSWKFNAKAVCFVNRKVLQMSDNNWNKPRFLLLPDLGRLSKSYQCWYVALRRNLAVRIPGTEHTGEWWIGAQNCQKSHSRSNSKQHCIIYIKIIIVTPRTASSNTRSHVLCIYLLNASRFQEIDQAAENCAVF